MAFKKNEVVCFFGDSITQHGYFIRSVYEYYLNTLKIPCEIYNCGVPGNTATQGLSVIEDTVLCHHPDQVVVCFGMNDIRYTLYDDIDVTDEVVSERRAAIDCGSDSMRRIAERLNKENIKMTFCTPTPYDILTDSDEPCFFGADAAVTEFGKRVKLIARDFGAEVVDYNAEFFKMMKVQYKAGNALHNDDRIHPNPKGHEIMAQIFLRAQGFDVPLITDFDELSKLSRREHSPIEEKRFELEQQAKVFEFIKYGICAGLTDPDDIDAAVKNAMQHPMPFISDCAHRFAKDYDQYAKIYGELVAVTKSIPKQP